MLVQLVLTSCTTIVLFYSFDTRSCLSAQFLQCHKSFKTYMNPVTTEYICRSGGRDTVKTENGALEKTTSKNKIKKAKADYVAKKVAAYLSVQQTFGT